MQAMGSGQEPKEYYIYKKEEFIGGQKDKVVFHRGYEHELETGKKYYQYTLVHTTKYSVLKDFWVAFCRFWYGDVDVTMNAKKDEDLVVLQGKSIVSQDIPRDGLYSGKGGLGSKTEKAHFAASGPLAFKEPSTPASSSASAPEKEQGNKEAEDGGGTFQSLTSSASLSSPHELQDSQGASNTRKPKGELSPHIPASPSSDAIQTFDENLVEGAERDKEEKQAAEQEFSQPFNVGGKGERDEFGRDIEEIFGLGPASTPAATVPSLDELDEQEPEAQPPKVLPSKTLRVPSYAGKEKDEFNEMQSFWSKESMKPPGAVNSSSPSQPLEVPSKIPKAVIDIQESTPPSEETIRKCKVLNDLIKELIELDLIQRKIALSKDFIPVFNKLKQELGSASLVEEFLSPSIDFLKNQKDALAAENLQLDGSQLVANNDKFKAKVESWKSSQSQFKGHPDFSKVSIIIDSLFKDEGITKEELQKKLLILQQLKPHFDVISDEVTRWDRQLDPRDADLFRYRDDAIANIENRLNLLIIKENIVLIRGIYKAIAIKQ